MAFLMSVAVFLVSPRVTLADSITGHITKLYISKPTNLPFRVILDTGTTCQATFFYVDGSSANYQVYVSALMLAYSQSKPITLVYHVDANNWCAIDEIGI